jgi:hypothetical protein
MIARLLINYYPCDLLFRGFVKKSFTTLLMEETNNIEVSSFNPHLYIQRVWHVKATNNFSARMRTNAMEQIRAIIDIGDAAMLRLEREESFDDYVTTFLWSERLKSYAILWRDILFQLGKAELGILDEKYDFALLTPLKEESHQRLLKAADLLIAYPQEEEARIRRLPGGKTRQISKWRLQNNPWPIYKNQLEQLAAQCEDVHQKQLTLKKIQSSFHKIRSLIQQKYSACETELEQFSTKAEKTIEFIEANIESKPGKTISYLEDVEEEVEITNHLDAFLESFEQEINLLAETVEIPLVTNQGIINTREINFRRSARLWLESEVLPLLYETWEITENANNGIRMAIINVRNRAIIIANDVKDNKPIDLSQEDICLPLKTFQQNSASYVEKLIQQRAIIATRIKEHFVLSQIYDTTKSFLPLPLQSTINQLRFGQNALWDGIRKRFRKWIDNIRQLIANVEKEEALSHSEKIVRFLQHRSVKGEQDQYSSIFLTKGYIGESFWVGREKEQQHVKSIIEQWKLGYRGAVCLSGQRFTGKTVFGELVAHQYFHEQTVRLNPNSIIRIGGRKVHTSYNLDEALAFVRKYTINQRALIWIDDLELWSDNNFSLGQNIRALKKHIDTYSNQLFFMVSMSTWFRAHLQQTHELDKIFQAEIKLDRMSLEEVRQAILIRHGATHKRLVDAEGNEVTPNVYRKMTAKIYRAADGNIGEALNLWSYFTYKGDGEDVAHDFSNLYNLPDFLTSDVTALLYTMMLEKRTNEYRLRKLFGPAFSDRYRSILQRLFSTGLVIRQLDGWVELNEAAVNEVGRLLDKKGFLKFY